MKITKVDALNIALSSLTADSYDVQYDAVFADGTPTIHTETYTQQEVREVIEKMVAQLSKPRSDEAKSKQSAARKAKTAQARAELVAKVAPVLREALTHTLIGVTAKELYDLAKSNLPEDFTANKVQYILLHEMASEVEKIEAKGKANLYRLIEG